MILYSVPCIVLHWTDKKVSNFITRPLGEASKKGAASTFGGVSTSDSEECRGCGLEVVLSNIGDVIEAAAPAPAAAAAASQEATGGNLTQQNNK